MISVYDNPIGGANLMREKALRCAVKDRLDNPFEQKCILQDEFYLGTDLEGLTANRARSMAAPKLDPDRHFTALMRYDVGDYLKLHYDAETHPRVNGLRKWVTSILYLSTDDCEGGELEFWRNDKLVSIVQPTCGTLVMFTNDLLHGNPWPIKHGVRIALTCSFMMEYPHLFDTRPKAYFEPRPGTEVWSDEMYRLRDLRCDPERYAEAYKVGV